MLHVERNTEQTTFTAREGSRLPLVNYGSQEGNQPSFKGWISADITKTMMSKLYSSEKVTVTQAGLGEEKEGN